jgi:hypothetical protein
VHSCQTVADPTLDQDKTMIWWTINRRTQVQIKDMNIKRKTRLVLITRRMNKTWLQLVLMKVRDNIPRLSIYTLNIYSTLLAAQTISKVVAWTSSYLACTLSCLKAMFWGPRHFQSSGLGPKSLGLHSKSTWLVLQAIQRRYMVPQGTATALR